MDSVLVERAKKGDKESFAALYEQVADDLYQVALYTLGNVHDAQDAVAETFLEAYRGLGSLRKNTAFKAWIMRILSCRCKRCIGRYVRDRGTLDVEELTSLSDDRGAEEQGLARADLLSALAELSPAERQIVVLSVIEGYTTKEIAAMLRSPQGTVSSKLYRALGKLRRLLGEPAGSRKGEGA